MRPSLTTWSSSAAFASSAAASAASPGSVTASATRAAARWIAVGKTSLLLCPRFTWSFGWTGRNTPRGPPPRSSFARFAMTSFAFMFEEVPLPVWKMSTGKSSSRSPDATSMAARRIASASGAGSTPSAPVAAAKPAFTSPSACTSATGSRRPESAKFSTARAVCAP